MNNSCKECGGMGVTIGFLGDKQIAYKCETCFGRNSNQNRCENISMLRFKERKKKPD